MDIPLGHQYCWVVTLFFRLKHFKRKGALQERSAQYGGFSLRATEQSPSVSPWQQTLALEQSKPREYRERSWRQTRNRDMDLREIFDNRFNRERREGRGNDSKKRKESLVYVCISWLFPCI
ncbi:Uncharacterized protein HZ326_6696 [Fusarium oxysporum f. sp. albedinis]|nr:Uncharacterized protein HZ326_6696 [Fusarium oxysporum f. sp. albedinis]